MTSKMPGNGWREAVGQGGPALLATILWMSLIFTLSAVPTLRSPLLTELDQILRKIAHFAAYSILALLSYWYLVGLRGKFRISAALQVLILATAYAALDEAHQRFVPGRLGNGRDVAVDLAGTLVILLWLAVWKRREARRP